MVATQGSGKDLKNQLELLENAFVGREKDYRKDIKEFVGAFGGTPVVKPPTKEEMAKYGKPNN